MALSKEQARVHEIYMRNLARIDGHEQDWLLAIATSRKLPYLEKTDFTGFHESKETALLDLAASGAAFSGRTYNEVIMDFAFNVCGLSERQKFES